MGTFIPNSTIIHSSSKLALHHSPPNTVLSKQATHKDVYHNLSTRSHQQPHLKRHGRYVGYRKSMKRRWKVWSKADDVVSSRRHSLVLRSRLMLQSNSRTDSHSKYVHQTRSQ